MYYGRVKNWFNENPKAAFPNLFSAEHRCSARSEGVLVTNIEKPRITEYFIKFEFSIFGPTCRQCSCKNFHGNLPFGYWQISLRWLLFDKWGNTKHMCSVDIYQAEKRPWSPQRKNFWKHCPKTRLFARTEARLNNLPLPLLNEAEIHSYACCKHLETFACVLFKKFMHK